MPRLLVLLLRDGSVRSWSQFVDGGKNAASYAVPARLALPMLFVGRRDDPLEDFVKKTRMFDYRLLNTGFRVGRSAL